MNHYNIFDYLPLRITAAINYQKLRTCYQEMLQISQHLQSFFLAHITSPRALAALHGCDVVMPNLCLFVWRIGWGKLQGLELGWGVGLELETVPIA